MGRSGECEVCEGEGFIQMDRCPTHTINSIPRNTREVFRAYRLFKDHGILPVLGGFYDQSAGFLASLELCEAAGRRIIERDNEHVEALGKIKRGFSNG